MKYDDIMKKYGFFIETTSTSGKMPFLHTHDSYEIYYLIHGSRDYFIEDSFFAVNKGDFILIPKNNLHRTSGNSCTRIIVSFTDEFLSRYCTKKGAELLLKAFSKNHVHPKEKDGERVLAIFEEMRTLYDSFDERLFILLAELLDVLRCAPAVESETPKPIALVEKITDYTNRHYQRIGGVKDAAQAFFLSESYLCRLFKKVTGTTYSDYLNKTKLRHAANLLTTSSKTVAQIAECCGFHFPAYFCNVFKKEYGLSPSEYKRANRKI